MDDSNLIVRFAESSINFVDSSSDCHAVVPNRTERTRLGSNDFPFDESNACGDIGIQFIDHNLKNAEQVEKHGSHDPRSNRDEGDQNTQKNRVSPSNIGCPFISGFPFFRPGAGNQAGRGPIRLV